MKKVLFILYLLTEIIYSQKLSIKSDTIDVKYEGNFSNCIKNNNFIYFFSKINNGSYSSIDDLQLNKYNLLSKTTIKIKMPKELQSYYTALYKYRDTIFSADYYDKTTYFLNKKNSFIKTNKAKDLVLENNKYKIYSIDLGEFGGYTWFIKKKTNSEYGIPFFAPIINELENQYYFTTDYSIIKASKIEYLKKAITKYESINENEIIKIIDTLNNDQPYIEKNLTSLFKNKNYYNPKYYFITSFKANEKIYHIYKKNKRLHIGILLNNKLKSIYHFDKKIKPVKFENDYRTKIYNNQQTIQFRTDNKYLNGVIEISDNKLNIIYINNTKHIYINSEDEAIDWFEKSLNKYIANFKEIKIEEIKIIEQEIYSREIKTTYKNFRVFRAKENNEITSTTEYYFSKEKNLNKIIYTWNLDWKIVSKNFKKKSKGKPITKEFTIKSNKIKTILFNKFGIQKNQIDYKGYKQSYEWLIDNMKIELYISNEKIVITIQK